MEFIKPPDHAGILWTVDPLALMEIGLERYQAERLGKCLLNCGDVVSICGSISRNRDVTVKNKGNYVDIIEIHRKVKRREPLPFTGEPIAYLNEEYQLKDWQKEVMEEDARQSGYLFGDAG